MSEIDLNKEKILFECNHIDDLKAYDMLRHKITITPLNAPISDFKLAIVENTQSPYAFSSICKRNDKWEYMGLGHSGACSLITALLKQLQQLKQENKRISILELSCKYKDEKFTKYRKLVEQKLERIKD